MKSCEAVQPLIARSADGSLDAAARADLDNHLASCADCREAVEAQRRVAVLLRRREPQPQLDLVARVRARLEEEAGVLGLANWRAWTLGLAPVAAALMLAAYLGIGISRVATTSTSSQPAAASDEWTQTDATASILMQPGTSGDTLVEAVLTGSTASTAEGRDVR